MGKSCGECGMCCKLLAIQSLDKPAGAWCGHFKRAAGCGVYEERPPACRGFVCLWLDSEKLDEAWRPDRAKFLMYTEKDGQRLNVIVDPNHPGAWKREPYYRRLKAMSELALGGASWWCASATGGSSSFRTRTSTWAWSIRSTSWSAATPSATA